MEVTGKPHNDFISVVSNTKGEKSQKLSIISTFSKYEDKFLKDKVKSEISDFKPPGDLNDILIKDNTSIRTEQEEKNELMSTASDSVSVVETIDGLILNNEEGKIANEEKSFRFLEMEHLELAR